MAPTAERVRETKDYDNPVYKRQLFAYESATKYINGDVLEIGCGEGYGAKLLANLSKSYTGIDKYKAQNDDNLKGIQFLQMKIPPIKDLQNNHFDTIVSFQLIEHIKQDRYFLEEVKRLLKPGGKFIFTTPNKKMSLTRNPYHIREYIKEELPQLLSMFSSYELYGVYGNEKMMKYHEMNKLSVQSITKFDIFNLQYNLPRFLLRIPYNIANVLNRKKIAEKSADITYSIDTDDFLLKPYDSNNALDFFCVVSK